MVVPLGNSRDIIAYECDPGLGLQVGLGRTDFFLPTFSTSLPISFNPAISIFHFTFRIEWKDTQSL